MGLTDKEGPPKVFVRSASGMVREISPLVAFVITTSALAIGIPANFGPVWVAAIYPGASFAGELTIALIPGLFIGILYILFTLTMPRSGGDYIFTSRVLSHPIGFMMNFVLTFWLIVFWAQDASWFIVMMFSPALAGLGLAMKNQALIEFAGAIATDPNTIYIGALVTRIAIILVLILGPRFTGRWLLGLFIIGMIGLISNFIVYATATPESFKAAYEANFGPIAKSLEEAKKAGWSFQPITIGATLASLPFAWLWYIGYHYSAYVAGEIKDIRRSMWISVLGCLIFGWLMYIIMDFLFYRVAPYELVQAMSYLFFFGPPENGYFSILPTLPGTYMFAGILSPHPILNLLIAIGQICWNFAFSTVVFMVIIRNIFAWSFDRVIPIALSDINRRFKSPLKASVIVFIAAIVFLTLYIYVPGIFALILNFLLGASIAFIIPGIAGIVFPWRRKDLYEA
ncbi:MAG: amino acid permease, partial [Nitrososphaerota archaeon]